MHSYQPQEQEPILQDNRWVFPDGKTLPYVRGGDPTADSLSLPGAIPGLNETPQPPVGVGEGFSDFAQGILNGIPEPDRPIVSKYIKDWDSNVTKKFQSIHDQYAPYKDLGPIEEIQQSLQYFQLLNNDPKQFISLVQEAMQEMGIFDDPQGGGQAPQGLPEYEGIPQEFLQEFQGTKKQLEEVSSQFKQFQQQIQEKEQMAQVDKMLSDLHTSHGEFDDQYVLMQLVNGATPEDAIGAWNENIVKKFGSPQKTPPILPGMGGVPNTGQVDLSKMSKQERLSYAVQAIQNANS